MLLYRATFENLHLTADDIQLYVYFDLSNPNVALDRMHWLAQKTVIRHPSLGAGGVDTLCTRFSIPL